MSPSAPIPSPARARSDVTTPAWIHVAAPAAAALAATLWGASFTFGKMALRQLDPIQTVTWRFILAALLFLPLLLWRRERPRMADVPWFLLAAFLGAPAMMLLQFTGLRLTTAATAALLIGTFPVVVSIAAVIFRHERLGIAGWTLVSASTVGAALVVDLAPGADGWLGPGLIVLSMLAAAGWMLTSKHLMDRYSAMATTAYTMIFGALLLLPFEPLSHQSIAVVLRADGTTWIGIAGLGIACTFVAFCLANWGLRHMTAYRAGILNNLEPLCGALLAVAVLHERLSAMSWVGGGLILAAALAVSVPRGLPRQRPVNQNA